jgi:16S rRNA (guanine1207-N2)-methyltransferase
MKGEHYFSERPRARGGRRVLEVTLRGNKLRLVTEAGVFSRHRVDAGTKLLIARMEIGRGDRVLDLGCGYGVVGLVAARLAMEGKAVLVDINERAVELARENLARNGVGNAEVRQGDGFAPVGGEAFDVIALNPPIRAGRAVIHRLIEQAKDHLRASGRFYLVGRTQQGVLRLAAKMERVFGEAEEVAKGGGYRLYLSRAGAANRTVS